MELDDVLQSQLNMEFPPTGWELVQALEANGYVIVRHDAERTRLLEALERWGVDNEIGGWTELEEWVDAFLG